MNALTTPALEASRIVKEYAATVAGSVSRGVVVGLTSKTIDAAFAAPLTEDERKSLLNALIAVNDVASAAQKANERAAKASANALRARVRLLCGAALSGSFALCALYFHEGAAAVVMVLCCVGLVVPEARAFVASLRGESERSGVDFAR